jgi:hypothetical protein
MLFIVALRFGHFPFVIILYLFVMMLSESSFFLSIKVLVFLNHCEDDHLGIWSESP